MKLVVSFIENFILKASVRVSSSFCCLILHVLRLLILFCCSLIVRSFSSSLRWSFFFTKKKNSFIQCFHSQFSFKSFSSNTENDLWMTSSSSYYTILVTLVDDQHFSCIFMRIFFLIGFNRFFWDGKKNFLIFFFVTWINLDIVIIIFNIILVVFSQLK